MKVQPFPSEATALLKLSLTGDATVRNSLYRLTKNGLIQRIKWQAKELPIDQHKDVFQEVWLLLLSKKPSNFIPENGHTIESFFYHLIKDAKKTVKAQYCPPGHKTRPEKDSNNEWIQPKKTYSCSDDLSRNSDSTTEKTANQFTDTSIHCIEDLLVSQIDAQAIMNLCPDDIKEGIILSTCLDYTQKEAAKQIGMSRTTMVRKISIFFKYIKMLQVA